MVETKCVACIGNFNGVHLGHQKLIMESIRLAEEKGIPSRMITFTPDPSQFYASRKKHLKYLSDDETKRHYVKQMGIDEIEFIRFDKNVADTSAADFINEYLNGKVETLVCGNDFTFGKNREGTVEYLLNYPEREFDLVVMEDVNYYGRKISTTRIIETIRKGNMKMAGKMMNHDYIVKIDVSGGIMSSDFVLPPQGCLFIANELHSFSEENGIYEIDYSGKLKDEPALVIYSF